jgi:hypothetical protein
VFDGLNRIADAVTSGLGRSVALHRTARPV